MDERPQVDPRPIENVWEEGYYKAISQYPLESTVLHDIIFWTVRDKYETTNNIVTPYHSYEEYYKGYLQGLKDLDDQSFLEDIPQIYQSYANAIHHQQIAYYKASFRNWRDLKPITLEW